MQKPTRDARKRIFSFQCWRSERVPCVRVRTNSGGFFTCYQRASIIDILNFDIHSRKRCQVCIDLGLWRHRLNQSRRDDQHVGRLNAIKPYLDCPRLRRVQLAISGHRVETKISTGDLDDIPSTSRPGCRTHICDGRNSHKKPLSSSHAYRTYLTPFQNRASNSFAAIGT